MGWYASCDLNRSK